ncbi:F-box only protein 34 isoform X1 [Pogona vitticeps]
MKSFCRAGLHRELLNSASSTLHPVKRISGMHLKPYLKLQKKERSLEISPDSPRSPPMSQQRVGNEEKPDSPAPGLFPNPPLRKPLGSLSPNTICRRNERKSHPEGEPSIKERRAALAPTIHQGDDGEGPLDIWAVVKPGNTKEKIAFFAAQQCSDHRVSSMKSKSSWDIEGRATKRRKKSLDIKRAKVHLERAREASGRCPPPEPFACSIEHCSVHNVNESGEGGFPGRPLSVVEMVAFLEQRASVLLAGCTKNCPSASAMTRGPGQSKAQSAPAPGPFPALGAPEAPSEKDPSASGDGEAQAEPVRVLEMVARLESECLRRQSEQEAGSLSRNNSFRRNVGRVLLASGTAPEPEAGEASSGVLRREECGGEDDSWGSKCSLSVEHGLWESPLTDQSSSLPGPHDRKNEAKLCQGDADKAGGPPCNSGEITAPRPFAYPEAVPRRPCDWQSRSPAPDGTPREPTACPDLSPNVQMRGSVSISLSVARAEPGCRKSQLPDSSCGEDALPGRLFLLLSAHEIPGEIQPEDEEASPEERSGIAAGKDASPVEEPHSASHVSGGILPSPPEGALQSVGSPGLKRQRSHDFLETRFKIQQLLEPQQYLVFLPHHIIVKIFGLLPTRSLVALKCTCGYFKFVIEYYNIRPADSRWVRDPRYREDPCKQCKKKYIRGDVSLCRWHPKPYCQALPYGPGYWMCCHRSQKSVPGCKLGLHDNHWVPACHSFNRAIHKKSREMDEDC